ncbi:MAG: aconitate hydratase, partial [Burkholderiales bacterium]
ASPPLVVAYAIAGRIDIDPECDPIGHGADGRPVFLRDLWPEPAEVQRLLELTREPRLYAENYADAYQGTAEWRSLEAPSGPLYPWDPSSTYLLEPPFFGGGDSPLRDEARLPDASERARALAVFGDALSTDHISPAGEIPRDGEAGRFLAGLGVAPSDFNAFTMRRGNHHVMVRGTFAHPRTRNLLAPDAPGGSTLLLPERRPCPVHEAARAYAEAGVPVIVLGGRDYGMGSSRDWAAT